MHEILGADQAWRHEFKELIREVVREELLNHSHPCRLNLSETDAREIGVWLKKFYARTEKAWTVMLIILLSTIVTGTIGAFWLGLKALMTAQGVN